MKSPVKRIYENFAGVDFANNEVSVRRSPDALNIYKNYNSELGKGIETRPGQLKLFTPPTAGRSYGFYIFEHTSGIKAIVHCGTKLYKWNNYPTPNTEAGHVTELKTGLNANKSSYFVFNDSLYIKDGLHYYVYNGTTIADVTGYIPTTYIGRSPSGGGTSYQAFNLLSPYRYNSFVGDDTSLVYQLDTVGLDDTYTPQIWVNDTEVTTGFTVNYTLGQITFSAAPGVPTGTGDNVLIKFKKTISGYADRILKCNELKEFDHRVFVANNVTYPNYLFHCELEDPTYFSDVAYYQDGLDTSIIKKLVPGNSILWAIKESSQQNPTVYYHVPTIDYTYGKIYPSNCGKVSVGCYSDAVNFSDDIVFMSQEGLKAVTGNISDEQLLSDKSSLVNTKLINETNFDDLQFQEWKGYLVCLVNNHIYLADSRQKWTNNDHLEYEWYYWENIGRIDDAGAVDDATLIKEYRGNLYIGTDDGYILQLTGTNDDTKAISSYWKTPKDVFSTSGSDNGNMLKTANKRGGIAQLKAIDGRCKVAVDSGKGFRQVATFTTNENTDRVIYKIKDKKWVEIQLKFYSDEKDKPFGLLNATLEAFVGGYVKRI